MASFRHLKLPENQKNIGCAAAERCEDGKAQARVAIEHVEDALLATQPSARDECDAFCQDR
jgi:hypothetical protein